MSLIETTLITKEEDTSNYVNGGVYMVSFNYLFLYNKFDSRPSLHNVPEEAFVQIWRSCAPLKVIVFSWQTLLRRLPTRANLVCRGNIPLREDVSCVCCMGLLETKSCILVSCPFGWAVWSKVHHWFGLSIVLSKSTSSLFVCFQPVSWKLLLEKMLTSPCLFHE
jgi:hypothetical protein